ncbi:cadherin EGF LAG seven-pass G-type receptor 2 isoform X3 [Hydra vulgaris]|uniref:Cadherin EGF LAG seven-pass G-type receptor 2 isoform X3 n=2 Tax=Hydra vulgaris TaxID=6087 RepID=A0ABM4DFZ5_HYDVU
MDLGTLLLILLKTIFVGCNMDHNKQKLTVSSQDKKYVILRLSEALPNWTHYHLDTSLSGTYYHKNNGYYLKHLKISSFNEIYFFERNLSCFQLDSLTLNISSLKYFNDLIGYHFLRNTTLLGSTFYNISKNCKVNLVKREYKLFINDYHDKIVIDLKFLIQNNPHTIICRNVSRKFLFISEQNNLVLKPRLFDKSSSINCQIFKQTLRDDNFFLKIYLFTSTSPVLIRKRRSSDIYFEHDQYAIEVKENIVVGETILELNVYGGSGKYIFKKSNDLKTDSLFKVDENSGEIKILNKLDREEGATLFALDITASDKDNLNLIAYTTVKISILDINDNHPIFSMPVYLKTIKEEQPLNQFILTVQASDNDIGINSEIKYSIIKNMSINIPFEIDEKTGVIKNVQILDREIKSFYLLYIKAEDKGVDPGSLFATVLVNITLEDINDNKPTFSKSKFVITLPEDTQVNQVILNVTATDADSGLNGKIEYRRLSLSEFSIDSSSGEIKLVEPLDYDRSNKLYDFVVDAFDCGFPPQHASVMVEVIVEDVNDNSPIFTRRSYKTSISESSEIGTIVFNKLTAKDDDSGENGRVTYSFLSDTPKDLPFSLDPLTGALKVLNRLDYEVKKSYTFFVVASDHGVPQRSDQVSVTIDVENINDNSPHFKNSSYIISISEDAIRGTPLLQVQAEDLDYLSSENFEYSIVDGAHCFQIDAFSGIVSLGGCKLDFKKQKEYNLKLKVIDLSAGEDQQPGFANLTINIYDANNNYPRFAESIVTLMVAEDVPIGTIVGKITATDDDSGDNAKISYFFQNPDENFLLNKDTGELYTQLNLDREKKLSYQLIIEAVDHGKPISLSSTTTVIISLIDVNDNAPKFVKDNYDVEILESVAIGSFVTTVSAIDDDDGINKLISYSIESSGDDSFAIASDTGIITTIKLLDREVIPAYKITVVATDKGIKQLSTSILVNIILKDVQDSSPVFEKSIYYFSINENSTTKTVGKVTATLADKDFQNNLIYSISKNIQNYFNIVRRTGVIEVSRSLDYEIQSIYILEVRASAPSGKEDKCVVNVTVLDINDHPPVLNDFYIFLNNNSDSDNLVFKVPATDVDVTSKLTYSILRGNEMGFVKLSENTGELLLQKSIMNTVFEVQIIFQVTDGENTASATGHITMSEINSGMVSRSMFIILKNMTKNTFLTAQMLTNFKNALSTVFSCDSRRIFILSIEDFMTTSNAFPLLEVVISVREETTNDFLPVTKLKDLFYLNTARFEFLLNISVLSTDYWNDIFCGAESCENFQMCSVDSLNSETKSNTVFSTNVVFRGVHINQKLVCTCQTGYGDGPNAPNSCSQKFSLCYAKPCGPYGKCISTDEGFTCICDVGYSGKYCNVNKITSKCPGTSPFALDSNPCGTNGQCVNEDKIGFRCQCHSKIENEFCTYSTAHFQKESYIALNGLKQRWNLTLSLEFATHDSDALILYNGRYSNSNDFIAIEIVNGQVVLRISKGSLKNEKEKVTTVESFIAGGVNDGEWHFVSVLYQDKVISLAVGQSCDVNIAHLINPEGLMRHCSASKIVDGEMKSLDLTAPLLIGGYPFPSQFIRTSSKSFVGCIRDITIDYKKFDFSSAIQTYNIFPDCPKKEYCSKANPCIHGRCIDGLYKAICECKIGFIGEFCDQEILSSPVVSLKSRSELVMGQIKSTGMHPTAIMLKTIHLSGTIWEEEINFKKAVLKISDGYPCYIFDSKLKLNLSDIFISDGKWHQLEVSWESTRLVLSADYKKFRREYLLYQSSSSQKMIAVGGQDKEKFVGCLFGFQFGGNYISLENVQNKNIESGCDDSDICSSFQCGVHGSCKTYYSQPQCHCERGYQGPKCEDICLSKPCLNSGVCAQSMISKSGFKCICPGNFTGDLCETEMKSTCDDEYYGDPKSGLCGPCVCKAHENFDNKCDKDGQKSGIPGKCFCKDTFYSLNGKCVPCDCLLEGSLTPTCNKFTGNCICKEKVSGQKCDRCPGVWQELRSKCNEINTSCPESYLEGIWWSRIRPGETQIESCPSGAIGNATRYCHERESWLTPDLFGCTSVGFANIDAAISQIHNRNISSILVNNIASQLDFAASSALRLYGKDVEIGNKALTVLVTYESAQSGSNLVSSDDHRFVENIIKSASCLFAAEIAMFWKPIQEKTSGSAGVMLQMEKLLTVLTNNLAFIKSRRYRRSSLQLIPYSQASKNIYLEIQSFDINKKNTFPQQLSLWWKEFPVWGSLNADIVISSEMFNNSNSKMMNTNIGLIIYKTLGNLLPSSFDTITSRKYSVDVYSDVFTVTIPNIGSSEFVLRMKHKNITEKVQGQTLICAYWNYSLERTSGGGWSPNGCSMISDNTSDIVCLCKQLGSFALIGIKYSEDLKRTYQPTSLTYLGLCVSLGVLFIIFLIYIFLSQLKSNFNSIHKNLVFATFLAELVFMLAINRTYIGESGCRIVAIIIHYFFTCTFSWLLVESLHMYRMILEPRDINYGQMMFYYFIGWGAPVMIVGVTAGLKPDGYGNVEFCWILIRDPEIMWTFFSPMLAIVAGIILLMVCVAITSCEKKVDKKKIRKIQAIRYRVLISFFFLPLFGGMIVAAVITVTFDHYLFLYIFPGCCVLTSLYIAMFYLVLNRKVRRELYNAYMRIKTGDRSYGIKNNKKFKPSLGKLLDDERGQLISEKYRATIQAFNVTAVSSTSDSSDTDGGRYPRRIITSSDATDFQTTNNDSSDSSDEEEFEKRRVVLDSDSDSSDNSSRADNFHFINKNGKAPQPTFNPSIHQVEWKQANQKKLIKRTYASDGPMHSTPSESEISEKKKPFKTGFSKDICDVSSELKEMKSNPANLSGAMNQNSILIETNNSTKDQPVSILKKKSVYDGTRKPKLLVKDRTRRLLLAKDDELNDSQV